MGWDISGAAKADAGEKIARVQIIINGQVVYDNSFIPPIGSWQVQLTQKGQYPGEKFGAGHRQQRQGRGNGIGRLLELSSRQ